MATETLISKSPLKPGQVTRIKGEYQDTERAAQEYEQALRASFKLADGQFPRFDLVLLGMETKATPYRFFPAPKRCMKQSALWYGTGSGSCTPNVLP